MESGGEASYPQVHCRCAEQHLLSTCLINKIRWILPLQSLYVSSHEQKMLESSQIRNNINL